MFSRPLTLLRTAGAVLCLCASAAAGAGQPAAGNGTLPQPATASVPAVTGAEARHGSLALPAPATGVAAARGEPDRRGDAGEPNPWVLVLAGLAAVVSVMRRRRFAP